MNVNGIGEAPSSNFTLIRWYSICSLVGEIETGPDVSHEGTENTSYHIKT